MKNIIKITALSLALLMALVLPVVAIGVSDAPLDSDNAWEAKVGEEALDTIKKMSDDELITIGIKFLFTEEEEAECVAEVEAETGWNCIKLFRDEEYKNNFISYVIAQKEEELGLEAGSLDRDSDEVSEFVADETERITMRFVSVRDEKLDEKAQAFMNTHMDPPRYYCRFYMNNISFDASKAEIISMANDELCTWIGYFDVAADPELSGGNDDDHTSFDDIESDRNGEDTMSNEDIIIDNTTGEDTSVDNSSEEILDALYGDVNSDGAVDSLDAAQVLKHDASLITLEGDSFLAADINGDGVADSLDGAYILKIDAGLIQ